MLANAKFQQGVGCDRCLQTGFFGRSAITELLVVKEDFQDAVLKKMPTKALEQVAVENGMSTLWQNGIKRVITGQTPTSEIMRVLAVE